MRFHSFSAILCNFSSKTEISLYYYERGNTLDWYLWLYRNSLWTLDILSSNNRRNLCYLRLDNSFCLNGLRFRSWRLTLWIALAFCKRFLCFRRNQGFCRLILWQGCSTGGPANISFNRSIRSLCCCKNRGHGGLVIWLGRNHLGLLGTFSYESWSNLCCYRRFSWLGFFGVLGRILLLRWRICLVGGVERLRGSNFLYFGQPINYSLEVT